MRRRKVGVDDEAEKAKRFAEPKASVETSPENNEKRPQRWRLDDLVFVVLAALAFGLIATVVVIASGFLYFHFEGAWRPVIHAGDAPRYEACDRLSRVPPLPEWRAKYVEARRPAVLVGAASHWPALSTWTTAHLKEKFGDAVVTVHASPNDGVDGVERDGDTVYAASKQMLFTTFVDKLAAAVPKAQQKEESGGGKAGVDGVTERTARVRLTENAGQDYALRCDVDANTCRADARRPEYVDAMVEDGVSLPGWYPHDMGQPFVEEPLRPLSKMTFRIAGGDDDETPRARLNPLHNFRAVIAGTVTLYLAPPGDAAALYYGVRPAHRRFADETGAHDKSRTRIAYSDVFSPVDLADPDFGKHPKARAATLFKCEAAAGDAMYVPPEYWHQVKSKAGTEGVSISLEFGQTPHLGVESREVMTPARVVLLRMFSPVALSSAKMKIEKALRAAMSLGLWREPQRTYATPGV